MFRVGPRHNFGQEGKGAAVSSLIIVMIGTGLVLLGYNTYSNQNQALKDPVNVTATVEDTGIREETSRRGGIDYQPRIKYEYSFDGNEYFSNNMHPGGQLPERYGTESKAREVVNEYSQGSEINVYVPPEKPGEAFIEPKKTDDPVIFIGIGCIFFVLGTYRFLKESII